MLHTNAQPPQRTQLAYQTHTKQRSPLYQGKTVPVSRRQARGEAAGHTDKEEVNGSRELSVSICDREGRINMPAGAVTNDGNTMGLHLRVENGV